MISYRQANTLVLTRTSLLVRAKALTRVKQGQVRVYSQPRIQRQGVSQEATRYQQTSLPASASGSAPGSCHVAIFGIIIFCLGLCCPLILPSWQIFGLTTATRS